MLKIRLTRTGRKNAPNYRIVIANQRDKRDGKAVAYIGTYDPMAKPSKIVVDKEAAKSWLEKGAQPTDTVRYLLEKSGVLTKPKKKEVKVFKVKAGKKAITRIKEVKEKSPKTETKTETAPTNE